MPDPHADCYTFEQVEAILREQLADLNKWLYSQDTIEEYNRRGRSMIQRCKVSMEIDRRIMALNSGCERVVANRVSHEVCR